jgi:hypothetical protein
MLVMPCRGADNTDAAAAELARQIAAITGPGVVSLSIRNNSSISTDEIPTIRRALQNNLNSLGIAARERGSADISSVVRITLSQTIRQGVWVAEVQQGPEVRVAIVNVPNVVPVSNLNEPAISLRKLLLFSQTDPILDAELISVPGDVLATQHLIVLSPEQVVLYRRANKSDTAWTKEQTFSIAHDQPWPRDVRGRLDVETDGIIRAYLPGVVCTVGQPTSVGEAALAVTCADSDDPWPVGSIKALFNSGRNYFTGVTIPSNGTGLGPFYSAATLLQKRGTATVFTEVGGQVRLFDGASLKPLAGSRDWGSDVAGVVSACGSGAQLLATASGTGTSESLLAYDVEGHSAIPVSAPLPLDGSVTAMWSAPAGQSSNVATVILGKRFPQQYEAYIVSLGCNQ